MKKQFLFCLLSLLCTLAFSQQQLHPTLSPHTKKYLWEVSRNSSGKHLPEGYVYKQLADETFCISAIIKVEQETSVKQQLRALNVAIGTQAGNIWTVQVPLD